jgi:hypothetical protein
MIHWCCLRRWQRSRRCAGQRRPARAEADEYADYISALEKYGVGYIRLLGYRAAPLYRPVMRGPRPVRGFQVV